ncbi:hypothetical protein C1Y40_02239 [Mycobacterium talmoniae]|uniref:DUF4333 domain-containing protein n=1 Tax=Mycobacterium talmoniae TaxID=1858794 RepID=A0A2S8BLM9_9MYCO|nr:hypothetical protein C1Y40_02239 [Mycobacterium talmoniae]
MHAEITKEMPKEKLASMTKEALEKQAGQKAQSVVCEGAIPAKVGATQRCVLTAMDGTKIGVTDTVTSVDGSDIRLDFVADDKAMP